MITTSTATTTVMLSAPCWVVIPPGVDADDVDGVPHHDTAAAADTARHREHTALLADSPHLAEQVSVTLAWPPVQLRESCWQAGCAGCGDALDCEGLGQSWHYRCWAEVVEIAVELRWRVDRGRRLITCPTCTAESDGGVAR